MSTATPIDNSVLSARLTITVSEFMALTGLGRTKTFALMKTGELTRIHVGRRSLISAVSVIRLLEGKHRGQDRSVRTAESRKLSVGAAA